MSREEIHEGEVDPAIDVMLPQKRSNMSKKDLVKEIKEKIALAKNFTQERFDDIFGDLDSLDKDTIESIK